MILYSFPVRTAFIDRDLEMIRPVAQIVPLEFTQTPWKLPLYLVLQFFQLLWHLPKTSQYLCFFGGYHTVLPVIFGRVFGKKCTIQAGGTDCINMPEIGYGNFRKNPLAWATAYSFTHCSLILPVAEALVSQHYTYDHRISPKQGLLQLIPGLKTPIQVIPNGFDTDFWQDLELERVKHSFISVATSTSTPTRARVKGYDLIEQLAANNSEWSFTLVGDSNYHPQSPNIQVLGKETPASLVQLYNRHEFYLQLSSSEGFPNALGEAMACGCVPIGSAVGAIPEIIGITGLLLKRKELGTLQQLIQDWMNGKTQLTSPRARIERYFTYNHRRQLLLKALSLKEES
jgi:glycosyltransferase involved in cell wall biosynthesis|uniref:glycosyltransferase family 4 protein n=3 Tax=Algoriphagus sp. TaxID=1872435 RepID=UPI0040481E20